MRRRTDYIVIHCSATKPGTDIGADEISQWHEDRGFDEIGYHAVIRRDGQVEFGRQFDEVGAHVMGQNYRSVGVCLVGGVNNNYEPENNFTEEQFESLGKVVDLLLLAYPGAVVVGHRDLSPDLDGDGVIEEHEWIKDCPSFDVGEWEASRGS